MTVGCHWYLIWLELESLRITVVLLLLITKMKVIATPEVYLYHLSLRRAMDAARFFSLVGLSLSLFLFYM